MTPTTTIALREMEPNAGSRRPKRKSAAVHASATPITMSVRVTRCQPNLRGGSVGLGERGAAAVLMCELGSITRKPLEARFYMEEPGRGRCTRFPIPDRLARDA